ncbi:hypothetical protein DFH09DRAFT_1286949 [Mycena vulgaris]|nr:hypothetical protein DFH09DRAFT_1286949 [Mycena vulgaris]
MTRPGFEPGFEPGSPPLHQFFVDNNRGRGSSRYRVSRSWERGEFKGVREMEGAHRSLGQTRYRKLTLQHRGAPPQCAIGSKCGAGRAWVVDVGQSMKEVIDEIQLECGGRESEGMESEKERVSLRSIAYGWEVQDIDSCADVPAMLGWTFETPGCASRALASLPDSRCPDCSRLWQAIICDTRRWNGNRTNKRKPHKVKARIRTKTLGVEVHSLDETEKLRGRESAEVERIETDWEWRNWRVDVDSIRVVHLHRYTLRRPLRRSRREEAQAESVERVRHCDEWSARRAGNLDIQYRLGI